MMRTYHNLILFTGFVMLLAAHPTQAEDALRDQAKTAMKTAASYYREKVASHGGYVYHYSPDFKKRLGEGVATVDQIWVQPPGTPTVGLAYLEAFHATGDQFYLKAATDAAEALVYGQLKSGGWTNCIDFDPRGSRTSDYRNGKGRGKNNSSLDDDQTQSAIRLLIHVDQAHQFQHKQIHQAAMVALEALLKAQFPNGAFPQVWTGPVLPQPVKKANYPAYDWRTEGKIKEYWTQYTLNDDLAGSVSETLIDAYQIYKNEKYLHAVTKLGDFLIHAQMPDPQPAWAQQYNYQMQPIWARRFEPAAISGSESQDVLETLIKIATLTQDNKYLKPIPTALAYLKKSQLADGQLARYYELKSNRPLYMFRNGKQYTLTYDDSNLPKHYGWKISSRLDRITKQYEQAQSKATTKPVTAKQLEPQVRQIIKSLDGQGRWMSVYQGERLVGQPKFAMEEQYLSSAVFSQNITVLSQYLAITNP